MKKIIKFVCDTCNRNIDKILNVNHYETDKCNITLGCIGRLNPVQYKSSADIAVAPEIGTVDWRARNTSVSLAKELPDAEFINLSTGADNQLTLAVQVEDFGAGSTVLLPVIVKGDKPKDFRQYTFVKEQNFSTISGVETGLEKKTLRFNRFGDSIDMVEVFLNGVKLEVGNLPNQFQISNGSESSLIPPNTIKFNSEVQVVGQTQVDIVVSKFQPSVKRYLTFVRNSGSSTLEGAWDGIRFIEKFQEGPNEWARFMTYTCDLNALDAIPLNSQFTIGASIEIPFINAAFQVNRGFFVLARAPYSSIDKRHNVIIPLETISERDHLKYFVEDNKRVIKIVETAVEEVYPLLKTPPESKIDGVNLIKRQLAGSDPAHELDGNIVIGPDE